MDKAYQVVRGLVSWGTYCKKEVKLPFASEDKAGFVVSCYWKLNDVHYKVDAKLKADIMLGPRSYSFADYIEKVVSAEDQELAQSFSLPSIRSLVFQLERVMDDFMVNPDTPGQYSKASALLNTLDELVGSRLFIVDGGSMIDMCLYALIKSLFDQEGSYRVEELLSETTWLFNYCTNITLYLEKLDKQ